MTDSLLETLPYDTMRRLFPAFRKGDKVMMLLQGTSQTEPEAAEVKQVYVDGRIYVSGPGFGHHCREQDLTPVAQDVDANRTGIYRHSSGRLYLVVGGLWNVTTKSPMVMYRPMYPCDKGIFCRTTEYFDGREENGESKFVKIANR